MLQGPAQRCPQIAADWERLAVLGLQEDVHGIGRQPPHRLIGQNPDNLLQMHQINPRGRPRTDELHVRQLRALHLHDSRHI